MSLTSDNPVFSSIQFRSRLTFNGFDGIFPKVPIDILCKFILGQQQSLSDIF